MERKMAKFKRPTPEIEGLVAASKLSPLIACSLDTSDRGLISAFVERWHKETSSFHFSIGEVTITLDDIASLLHLPIVGSFHSFLQLHVDDVVEMFESGTYAWGVVALVHMYDNLNEVSKSTTRKLARYITLLQCWIYEHFLSVGSALVAKDYDEIRPCACRWTSCKALLVSTYHRRLDRLIPNVVCWIPYGDHRSFREFEDAFVEIADKLERLLNLRILIEGTKAYIVAEECEGIARRFIHQPVVCHRSRRRQRTHDH
ncbi:Protein MAIN-LIKE 2 [Glycine max]|nr:Protein MAIN-LIKE 2 [Glycine max]